VSTTTTTSSKQPEGQTTRATELTTSKDVVNVASIEVPEQVHELVSEQEPPEQEAPEQSLSSTLSEGQVPKTNRGMPEQTMITTSSTQGDLPDAVARGKMAVGPSTAGPNQEQGQTSTDQAAESDDDVVEEIQGHP
jgi:hypothetical protein